MEGLEIVEISFKQLNTIIDYRIEAEYFDKRFLLNDLLLEMKSTPFFNIANYDNGRAYISEEFLETPEEDSIKIAKIGDVTQKRFVEEWDYLSKKEFEKQKGTLLQVDDIIMTLTGDPPDVGKVSILLEMPQQATWNQRVAKVYLRNDQNKFISQKVFFIVLASKYCREQLERYAKGIRQRNLGIECLKEMKVPYFSTDYQNELETLINFAHQRILQSRIHYVEGEKILLQQLNLTNWEPITKTSNIKSFNESFIRSGRLDAEFYQPKYDDLENAIKAGKHKIIKEIRTDNFRGLQPIYVEDGDLDVINSKHILDDGLDYDSFEKTSMQYWNSQQRARVFKGDILTYTTGANIGRTQVYLRDEKALASNHVNIMRLKEENPYYVAFVLNSIIGRLQTEKRSAGSAQAELYPKDLDEFLIPIIDTKDQKRIAELIQKSFELKTQSQQLLQVAKRAVEIAIEEGEKNAMAYINQST